MIGLFWGGGDAAPHRGRVQKAPRRVPIKWTLFYIRRDHVKENDSNQSLLRSHSSCPPLLFFLPPWTYFLCIPLSTALVCRGKNTHFTKYGRRRRASTENKSPFKGLYPAVARRHRTHRQ